MSIYIILNPASAGGAGKKTAPKVEAALRARGIEFELHTTEAPGHGETLAREAAQRGAEAVLAVGGDGTIHEVANGLLSVEGDLPAMGVIPLGTGNDFYRMVGAPKGIEPALDTLAGGYAHPFDVGRVRFGESERFFVNLLGIGIDVAVLERREGVRRLSGLAQYLAALAGALRTFRPVGASASFDAGASVEGRVMIAAVTVGPSIGGGFMLNPGATPDDGKLDMCWIGALNLFQVLRVIPQVIKGTHGTHEAIELRRFASAVLSGANGQALAFELDGEVVRERAATLEIDVVPGRLRVFVPKATKAT